MRKTAGWMHIQRGGTSLYIGGIKLDVKFGPGAPVWVVERDEAGESREVSGYMFLASCREITTSAS